MTQAAILAASGSPGTTTGFKNRIINGNMTIAQRGTSFTGISTDGVYTLDRWQYANNGGGAVSSSQSSTAPAGFINSILTTVTTADGTVSSGSYYQLRQPIEGLNCSDLGWGTANAKSVAVSFWVNCSVTGTYTFTLRNNGGANSYVTTYSIPTANTWTYITVTVPGPTSGTWLTTNGIGIFATWDFGTGSSSVTSSTNTWISGNYTGATGATKLINTSGATFYFTGVQLEVGTTATNFDFRSYGTELSLCQRYYEVVVSTNQQYLPITNAYYVGGSDMRGIIAFKQTKRAIPTLVVTSGADYYTFYRNGSTDNMSNLYLNDPSPYCSQIYNNSEVSGTAGQAGFLYANSNSAYVAWSAEL